MFYVYSETVGVCIFSTERKRSGEYEIALAPFQFD